MTAHLTDSRLIAICGRFEAAWKEALRGSAVPSIADYQDRSLSASQTRELQRALQAIEDRYRQSLSGKTAVVQDTDPGFSRPASDQSESESDGEQTIMLESQRVPDGSETMMLTPGEAPSDSGTDDAADESESTLMIVPDADDRGECGATMMVTPDADNPDECGATMMITPDVDDPEECGATMMIAPDRTGDDSRSSDATMMLTPESSDADQTLFRPPDGPQDDLATVFVSGGETPKRTAGGRGEQVSAEIPGYEILGELGRGGMGVVYRALQLGLNRMVALKMILAGGHAGADQLARFRAEGEAVAQLQHPNIVQIYDIGESGGFPYFSLEFVEGQSLEDLIGSNPQQPDFAVLIVKQLAEAMQYAHDKGIVHRDLKPENVLMTRSGIPKVSDFGLVKRTEDDNESSRTRTGTIMGTPSYMSPEQARGEKDVGPLTDVYALGGILYKLLTGRPPFVGATAVETVMHVINEEPAPPSRLQPGLAADLETMCLKCLQKDPHRRYATAGEFAVDLDLFLNDQPILARPVGNAERVWRWCRRNPALAGSIAAVLLMLTGTAVGATYAAIEINTQRVEAENAKKVAERNEMQAEQAKQQEEVARDRADENAKLAVQQASLAVKTMNDVVTRVEEKLRDRAEMTELRQQVLDIATKGLDEVARSDKNAALADRTMGAAYHRMAEILFKAGQSEEAQQKYERALVIFEKLLEEDPLNDLAMYNAALSYDGLGDLAAEVQQDASAAQQYYLQALHMRQKLAEIYHNPKLNKVIVGAVLVNSYNRLTNVALDMLGDPVLVREYCDELVAASETLAAAVPGTGLAQQAVAGAQFRSGSVDAFRGQLDQARERFEEALPVRLELLNADTQSVKAQQDVAVTRWALGEVENQSGNHAAALEQYLEAHKLRLALYQQDPDNPEMQWDLSESYFRIGVTRQALGEIALAEAAFAEAVSLRENVVAIDSENISKQIGLLLALARNGDHVRAAEIVDMISDKIAKNPGALVAVAGGLAQCYAAALRQAETDRGESADISLIISYSDRALDALNLAVDGGYRNLATFESEMNLEPLRSMEPFAALTQRLLSVPVSDAK